MTKLRTLLLSLSLSLWLSACSYQYACPVPDGNGACASITEVYEADARGESVRHRDVKATTSSEATNTTFTQYQKPQTIRPGDPIFREPRKFRGWFVDWQDTYGHYYPSHYVHFVVDEGEFLLPEARQRLMEDLGNDR